MIVVSSTGTNERMVVTLKEKAVLTSPNYLFVFTHVTTKQVVKWITTDGNDLSTHKYRYNEFAIDCSTVFAGQQPGQWQYEVYEQFSAVNTDPTGLTLLERGKLLLQYDSKYQFSGYNVATQYKGYAG